MSQGDQYACINGWCTQGNLLTGTSAFDQGKDAGVICLATEGGLTALARIWRIQDKGAEHLCIRVNLSSRIPGCVNLKHA